MCSGCSEDYENGYEPTDEELLNWQEYNDYVHEGDDEPEEDEDANTKDTGRNDP